MLKIGLVTMELRCTYSDTPRIIIAQYTTNHATRKSTRRHSQGSASTRLLVESRELNESTLCHSAPVVTGLEICSGREHCWQKFNKRHKAPSQRTHRPCTLMSAVVEHSSRSLPCCAHSFLTSDNFFIRSVAPVRAVSRNSFVTFVLSLYISSSAFSHSVAWTTAVSTFPRCNVSCMIMLHASSVSRNR